MYDDFYALDDQYLARRQFETRRYEAEDEESLLIACAQVLQDLGFTIEESETKLGLITASKDREACPPAQKAYLNLLAALSSDKEIEYDVSQKIYVTLVSTKSHNANGYNVRVKFARIIWNNKKESRTEKIADERVYSDFFEKLSQPLFLTTNDL
ncbi:MAG: hypothetical protein K2L13_00730, partial [Opitutales bacterium]|nr:hypothetical protein [Opitutales bacterium]